MPKIVSQGLHFKEKYGSTVSKNDRNTAGFFFGSLEENGLRSKALIKFSFHQIWQLLLSGFWFQGVPTCSFQQRPRAGLPCPGTVGSLRPQVGPGCWQCPGSVHKTLRVCMPSINMVAESSHPLIRTNWYIWGSWDGNSPLRKSIRRDTGVEWHKSQALLRHLSRRTWKCYRTASQDIS